ncbi:MAG: electron transfer flavoprotein subunit beta/FixA family protein [Oligoflexia bacterium]|nr:electron transfer flavoprotein subunit beta/FixA family protein [Oligoflexia bacterium]
MKIFVCVKQVPDTETKIKIASDGKSIDTSGVKWILCPYDEFAVEEAIRFKEKNSSATITVLSAGPDRVVDSLRTALAMGCDDAIHIQSTENADSFITARALAKAIEKEGPAYLVFTGKQAIDDDAAQVHQALAESLDLAAATVVLNAEYGDGVVRLSREIEGGALEKYELKTPCVIAAQKGMNEPRYASLPNIMKAKKKEVKKMNLSDLGIQETDQKISYSKMTLPPERGECKMISGDVTTAATELVRILKDEAKVI